jgi:hypothetical protein
MVSNAMRRTLHILLSAAPQLTLALLVSLAGLYPMKAQDWLNLAWTNLQNERLSLSLAFFVLAYFALWWWSAIEPDRRNKKLLSRLKNLSIEVYNFQNKTLNVETDDDFSLLKQEFQAFADAEKKWFCENMGDAAWVKIVSDHATSHSYPWNGEHSPQTQSSRERHLDFFSAISCNVDDMLKFDSWDPADVSLIQRVVRWFKCRATQSTN